MGIRSLSRPADPVLGPLASGRTCPPGARAQHSNAPVSLGFGGTILPELACSLRRSAGQIEGQSGSCCCTHSIRLNPEHTATKHEEECPISLCLKGVCCPVPSAPCFRHLWKFAPRFLGWISFYSICDEIVSRAFYVPLQPYWLR